LTVSNQQLTYFQEDGMWQTKVLDEEIEVSGSWSTE